MKLASEDSVRLVILDEVDVIDGPDPPWRFEP
jgi:hypothetical protein